MNAAVTTSSTSCYHFIHSYTAHAYSFAYDKLTTYVISKPLLLKHSFSSCELLWHSIVLLPGKVTSTGFKSSGLNVHFQSIISNIFPIAL